jgi:hypothetical protein
MGAILGGISNEEEELELASVLSDTSIVQQGRMYCWTSEVTLGLDEG